MGSDGSLYLKSRHSSFDETWSTVLVFLSSREEHTSLMAARTSCWSNEFLMKGFLAATLNNAFSPHIRSLK